ncbi:signal transduction histidine kinase/ActR/RegA family two-component response regulator [Duganella sp. 1411]|uniref:hybrid sensor histidine kinase/response regulator n=1 Tax=Duganella sp. 1411 TaxID=2806572 RepID=UPI001AE995F8|nr:ATP-binding protein [Duganella sp. 1411]MBP1203533.1 signal transduction histidine kinase/ActR/RegA family two-component response regulator [Duganella sp. 1411]
MTFETSLIVQFLPFAITVLDATPDFVIRHASDEYLAATRSRRADLIDRPLFDAFPAATADADGPARLRASLEQVIATGRAHAMEVQRYDVPDRDGDGFIVKYWLPTNIPVPGEDGAVRFILHRLFDLTAIVASEDGAGAGDQPAHLTRSLQELRQLAELVREGEGRRRNAEARATEAGERLELAVAAGELGTFYCPMPMGKIFWNDKCKEHFFVPEDAEIDFDLFYSRIHPDDRERTRAAVDASVENKKGYDVEYRVVAPDGRERWLRAKGRTYFDRDGAPTRFDGITIDISDTKRVEAELARSNQQKDDFLAMLAHELRNPLAPITAAADLLALAPPEPARIARMSEVLSRQARHMSGMLDDLLDVSRVTRGMVELNKEVLDCKQVVAAALEQVQPLIEARGHKVRTQITHEPARVLGDEKRLVQMLANLLNNAAKYTPARGAIELALRIDGDEIVVTVADNGIGIAADLLPHVFELFVQGARTPDRAQGGLGLGLALVKSMVELHDGRAAASSGGVGAGSVFEVRLPRHRAAAADDGAADVAAPGLGKALRIVVVDDNADAAWTLATCLRAVGHSVEEMTDPRTALAIAAEEVPDVFLLDIGMPGIDGYELARRLRAQPHTAPARLIAVTGYGNPEEQAAGHANFDHYLVKPVNFEKLTRLLSDLAESPAENVS